MPLFRTSPGAKVQPGQRRMRKTKWTGNCGKTDEDGSVLSLTRLCLLSLADNMKEVWAKDYADNYLDHYTFRHIMGPFNLLPGELVEELMWLLGTRQQLSRAALHLLLVPQLRSLSLEMCPGLITSALCTHIAARCQGLWSLDLSGAQQLPSKVLSETLCCLPNLRSLSLAGMPCDRYLIRKIAYCCRLLRHLDVSRCHLLSPAALLSLGGGAFCSSSHPSPVSVSSSCSDPSISSIMAPLSPLPLSSLLALDIGFGEQEEDPMAAAAYLLLALPGLERLALEGLAQACCLIEHREFSQTNEFADREGIPRLEEVWRERMHSEAMAGWRKRGEAASADKEDDDDEEEEERTLWEGYRSDDEEDASRDKGPKCSQNQTGERRRGISSQPSDERLILHLKDVKGLNCDSLCSLGRLCPDIISISMNIDSYEDIRGTGQGSLLAAGLQTWSGQLRSLSVHYPGPLVDLLPALQLAGSSLVSLTLDGVKTSPHSPLLEVIKACPRLRDLLISAEPPTVQVEEEEDEEEEEDQDRPHLPNLCSLRLKFSYEHSQMKPVMSWMSLRKVLRCLLTGSPLLERLSLVALPCPLNLVLQDVLRIADSNPGLFSNSTDSPPVPFGRVQHIDLQRTNVEMSTVKSIMRQSKRLKFVDLSYCWQIIHLEWLACTMSTNVQVVWA
ncbi:uncharacterized protein si:ch211-214j8.12 [Anabas testudineus]|uniref:Uncharacterized protein n=1 Tax=Anabas testudineus TaxID=64144 RepID=A0A3Q1HAF5_ANATE|nr:uncharacterized protein si:ch211-214j8.12 [Anabas testudineus]